MVRRDSPIVKRGWIDILFKSGPPHLQIIHTLLPGAVPSLPHPRLPCHTQNRVSAQMGRIFLQQKKQRKYTRGSFWIAVFLKTLEFKEGTESLKRYLFFFHFLCHFHSVWLFYAF